MKTFTLRKILVTTVALSFLSGCTLTEGLWGRDLSGNRSRHSEIYSFGFTKPDSKNLTPNRLIMLGKDAVYVTEVTPEHDLVNALRATDLSKPFGFYSAGYLNVALDNEKDGNFVATSGNNTQVCLDYVLYYDTAPVEKKNDIAKLKKLGFKKEKHPSNHNVTDYYVRCYGEIRGVHHAMSGSLPAEYRFKSPILIYLDIKQISQADRASKTTGAALLTPASILGDILLFPIMAPLLPYKNPRI